MIVKDLSKVEKAASRDGYGKGLVALAKNKDVVALCADLTESVRVNWFSEKHPNRFVEVGVQEQNMAGVAAGMALAGKIPFMSSYAVFSPGRNWDQIRVSICYTDANVKIQGCHAGLNVGPDGATHQALEDIAITRVLPNMTVIVPCDAVEGYKATVASAKIKGPVYLRFGRDKVPVITLPKSVFKIGKANVLRTGTDVTIVACGLMVYEALVAAEELAKKKISCEVINCHTIKPIDVKTIVTSARKTGKVITAEEHQIHGGLGSAVAEVLGEHHPVPIRYVGVKDTFGESGTATELLTKYGCSSKAVKAAVTDIMR